MDETEKAEHGVKLFAHLALWFEEEGIYPRDAVEVLLVATVLLAESCKQAEKDEPGIILKEPA